MQSNYRVTPHSAHSRLRNDKFVDDTNHCQNAGRRRNKKKTNRPEKKEKNSVRKKVIIKEQIL